MPTPVDEYGTPISTKRPTRATTVDTSKSLAWGQLTSGIYDRIQTVITALASGDHGAIQSQQMMFLRMMELDERISAAYATRREALLQAEWGIARAETDESTEPKELIEEQLRRIRFSDLIEEMHPGIMTGVTVHENVYGADWGIAAVQKIPEWYYDWTGDELLLKQGGKVIHLEPNKYIRFVPSTHPGPRWRQGIMRTLAVLWCLKHAAMKDWAAFVEIFAIPLRVGRYPDDAKTEHIDALREGVKKVGTDAACVIPNSMDIDFPELKSQHIPGSVSVAEQYINFIDKAVTIRLLGSHLQTQSESGSGTLAGNAQERPTDWIVRGDSRRISSTIERDLFRPLVEWHLGGNAQVPRLVWPGLDDSIDQQARAKVFALAQEMGWTLSRDQVGKELQLQEPADEADELEAEELEVAEEPEVEGTELSHRGCQHAELSTQSMPAGSPHRGGEKAVLEAVPAVSDQVEQLNQLMARLVDDVLADQPGASDQERLEMVMQRFRLEAGDLDELIDEAGFNRAGFEEQVLGVLLAASVNGRKSVADEEDA
jgi:phage gp29-like protein